MTIAKDFASKAAIAFVALAMIFSMFAPAAKAQSNEDLQTMINTLLAQIAALQAQVGQGGSTATSAVCPYTWTRDLKTGATGADVMKLQAFLNSNADTRVAATGAGSAGMETETFGPATAAAVSKFQVSHRAEILTPAGLVNPTGFFGPSTRAKANALCATAVVTPGTGTGSTTDDVDDETPSDLSGEASLDSYEADDASDDTIEEGAEDAEVAVFTAQFSDGDAEISRLDVAFTNPTTGADAWNAFETVSLWVDGKKVAEEDASSKDDYLGDEDDGVIRFSNLHIVGMDDEDVEITVAVTVPASLDAEELSTWTVTTESLRFFDADGVASTEDSASFSDLGTETAAFTLEAAGTDDEVIVKSSTNNPVATTLKVNDDKKSDKTTVFAFDLDTDDSTNDIELTQATMTVSIVSPVSTSYNTIVDDAELVINGTTITDVTVTGGNATGTSVTATLTFNIDSDVTIDAGDRVEAELVLTFKSLAANLEGTTVTANVYAGAIDAEGADTFTSTGAATGKVHTLRTAGAILEAGDMTETLKTNSDTTTADDQGTFVVKFDVTAFDQDIYVNKSAVESTSTATTQGVNFIVTDGSGVRQVSAGTTTASLSSTADTEGTQYRVNEGETKTFTLTVTFDPTTAGFYGAQVYSFNFDETAGSNPSVWQIALPAEDYESDPLSI